MVVNTSRMRSWFVVSLLSCGYLTDPVCSFQSTSSSASSSSLFKIKTRTTFPTNNRLAEEVEPVLPFSARSSSSSTSALQGIPKMFRWLTDQYPDIINKQLEVGLSAELEVDNFYLDMNGIIHPCTHGNAKDEIIMLDETAMFKKIFLYVDRLYKMVRPSGLLYLAVDGVAPRAKMNQQRSRRFRSAKEAEIMAQEMVSRQNYAQGRPGNNKNNNNNNKKGGSSAPRSPADEEKLAAIAKNRFDSNCITPGTDFMLKLNLALNKWVEFKMKTDPFWQNGADVVVTGPNIPGEGEHKVMDYIRLHKKKYYDHEDKNANNKADELPTDHDGKPIHYQPGLTHVLYGLDADLIMLGLVTNEYNFNLLREKMSVVMAGRGRNKYRKKKDMMEYDKNDFEVLELNSLRQLLSIQFRKFADANVLEVKYELSRVVDDFIFMCMLVGNDFLPHCPHLEIDNGALSLMMTSYIDLLPEWKGYLTDKEKIHPQRLEQFVYHLAVYEEEHFKRRGYEENEPGWKLSSDFEEDKDDFYGTYYTGTATPTAATGASKKGGALPKERIIEKEALFGDKSEAINSPAFGKFRKKHPDNLSRSYRDFYYEEKMGWDTTDRDRTLYRRRAHIREYLEGLHWNLNYYHNGCRSWDWFFPYFYSPLATDMVNLIEFYDTDNIDANGFASFDFELGTPIPSLAQLLSVLPPQSATLLPKPMAELMVQPASPILQFYPNDFTSDANGKRQSWEAIVKIPFIDAQLLADAVDSILDADQAAVVAAQAAAAAGETESENLVKPLLTKAERMRNMPGKDSLYQPPPESERLTAEDVQKRRQERNDRSGGPAAQKKKATMSRKKKAAAAAKAGVSTTVDYPNRKFTEMMDSSSS